jgi:tetratricopeptide (TPR) repeat protein
LKHEYYNDLGLVLQKRKEPRGLDQAVCAFRRALELYSQTGTESDVYENNLASALSDRGANGDLREAITHYQSAFEIATRAGLSSSKIADYVSNIGDSCLSFETSDGDLEAAILWYERAVTWSAKTMSH